MMKGGRKLSTDELGRLDVSEFKMARKLPVTVVLDNVRSLHNIGSIFRSCDAFRVEKLVLCGISTPPPHREIHKSALGAELSVDWEYFAETPQAIMKLRETAYTLIACEQTAGSIRLERLYLENPNPPLALVFGHEIRGVSQQVIDLCDHTVEIPQFGTKHSFNIAVSVGIVLWEISRAGILSRPIS